MVIKKRHRRSLAAVSLALGTAACAGPNLALKEAQDAYDQARSDPQVASLAPEVMHEAEQSLRRAEEIEEEQDEVEHLAYMAKQQVAIARAEAQGRAAKAEVQQSLERQDEIVTEALADEAATAQLQAHQLEQETRALEQELAALKAEKTERGYVLTLGDVLFEVDRSSLKPGAQRNLYQLVTFLKEHPQQKISIEGHTDSTASDAYNLDLSERRARAVAAFLVQNGVVLERIMIQGYGESYPKASNDTVAGRQENRRVEIVFTEKGEPTTAAKP
ncbi:MAG: OmpA family protein [Gammaproteobacteria bacterium]